jgi:hypothetical protein
VRCLNGGGFTQERLRPRTGGELHVQARRIGGKRCAAEECREALLAEWTADLRRRTVIVRLEP